MNPSTRTLLNLILLFKLSVGYSTTYYVSPSGNNSQSGTLNAPFGTIQYAVDFILPGDSIILFDGTYSESVFISQSGNSSAYKTLRSLNNGAAIIALPFNFYADGIRVEANYWKISGLKITDANLTADDYGHGIYVLNSHHIEIKDNEVFNCGGSGIQTDKSDHILIENNLCYENAKYNPFQCSGISLYQARAVDSEPGYHVIVRNNVAYNNRNITTNGNGETTDGNGIIIDDFRNTQDPNFEIAFAYRTLVENNLVYKNGGKGVHVFFTDHVDVYNNTSFENNDDLLNIGTFRGELSNVFGDDNRWRNNIGVASVGEGILQNNSAIMIGFSNDVVWENNLSYSNIEQSASVFLDNTAIQQSDLAPINLLGVDPQLQNTTELNFRLNAASPCIDAGSDDIVSFIDLDYTPRQLGAVDIGCYEFGNTVGNLLSNAPKLNIYPNPSMNRFDITGVENPESIVIFNAAGNAVKTLAQTSSVDVTTLPPGFYTLKIKANQQSFSGRFIVVR